MHDRPLGKSKLQVPAPCLGTPLFGDQAGRAGACPRGASAGPVSQRGWRC